MSKQIKITTPGRGIAYTEDDTSPFWLEHRVALIVIGLIALVGCGEGNAIAKPGLPCEVSGDLLDDLVKSFI